MCGIALVLHRDSGKAEAACRRATAAISHRGPDNEGFQSIETRFGTLVLGHRRLAILDLTPSGAQPMMDPQTGNSIIFNGEIYNFRALKSELESRGIRFRGKSDTEVLLKGYSVWGIEVFDKSRGMFAAAIWDATKQRLSIARDHAGMKPLYIYQNDSTIVVASELKSIAASGLVPLTIDSYAVRTLLAYGSVVEPLTMYENVKSFPPASVGTIEFNAQKISISTHEYWQMPKSVFRNINEADFTLLFANSIKGHLESDVPVGVFLSGGVDSTAVAENAAEFLGERLHSFTVGFPDFDGIDESLIAEETAKRLGTTHTTVNLSESDSLSAVNAWLSSIDQPCLDGFNTYLVTQAARSSGLKVALSGLGGDELFGGYSIFRTLPKLISRTCFLKVVPASVRRLLAHIATLKKSASVRNKAILLADHIGSVAAMVLARRRLFSDRELIEFGSELKPEYLTPLGIPIDRKIPSLDHLDDIPAMISRMEASFYMRDTLLRDSDVSGMAHGFEIRLPFLDRDLMDAAFQIPKSQRMSNDGVNKPVLVAAAGPRTKEISKIKKRGFALPYADWLRGPLKAKFEEGIEMLVASGLLEEKAVRRLQTEYMSSQRPKGDWSRVWTLAVLGHWLERHADRL